MNTIFQVPFDVKVEYGVTDFEKKNLKQGKYLTFNVAPFLPTTPPTDTGRNLLNCCRPIASGLDDRVRVQKNEESSTKRTGICTLNYQKYPPDIFRSTWLKQFEPKPRRQKVLHHLWMFSKYIQEIFPHPLSTKKAKYLLASFENPFYGKGGPNNLNWRRKNPKYLK